LLRGSSVISERTLDFVIGMLLAALVAVALSYDRQCKSTASREHKLSRGELLVRASGDALAEAVGVGVAIAVGFLGKRS
jgi:hypothetical protein